jgi:hypothetical protein
VSLNNDNDGNEIFIIDDDIIINFFKDSNYERSQIFFIYLTTHCMNRKAFMIPSLFDKIINIIKKKTSDKGDTIQTEVISYFENWVAKAELLGEDIGDEKHDTKLLYKLLMFTNPECKIILLSNKYNNEDQNVMNILQLDKIWSYVMSNKKFKEFVKANYGLDDEVVY